MPSSPTIDVQALLAPIPGAKPSGEDLRFLGPHDEIKKARRSDDQLPRGDWQRETKTANWNSVIKLASETLAEKSKDLQIAAWLTEALLKRYGIGGLRDGIELIVGLHDRFWDSMYPAIPEDGDLESRSGPLIWLDKELAIAVKGSPLTKPVKGRAYSYLHWEESREVDNLARKNPAALSAALEDRKITGEQFDRAVTGTPLDQYISMYEDLNQTCRAVQALAETVDQKFGKDAPGLLQLKKSVDEYRALVERIIKKRGGTVPDTLVQRELDAQQGTSPAVPSDGSIAATSSEGAGIEPVDRQDALRRLVAIGDFFRRTEPHTPIFYLVQRAVRWGDMPFDSWLQEVINDQAVLAHVRETLGIQEAGGPLENPHSVTDPDLIVPSPEEH
jgi:type VI secretion system protein ImpA